MSESAHKKNASPKAASSSKLSAEAARSPSRPAPKNRRLRTTPYTSFALQKRVKVQRPELPSGFRLFRKAFTILFANWKIMLGIIGVYTLLNVVFVQGFGNLNVAQTKTTLAQTFTGKYAHLATGLSTFAYLLGSANATVSSTGTGVTPTAASSGSYQFFLFLVASLAVIWALRQLYAGEKIRVRDAYYEGMTPAVPFVLVLGVVALQMLPLFIGSLLYTAIVSNGIAALAFEKIMWLVVLLLFAAISLYMVCSSIFALYIATLPKMTPMRALRSAGQLVVGRRWMVIRRLLFLPLALLLLLAIIIVPLIMVAAPLASWVFLLLSMLAIALAHSYMYALYRELL